MGEIERETGCETGVNRGSIEVKQGWRSVKKKISPKWAYF